MNKKVLPNRSSLAIIILIRSTCYNNCFFVDDDIKLARNYATESQVNLIEDSAKFII